MCFKLVFFQDKVFDGISDRELFKGWWEVIVEEFVKDMIFVVYIFDYYEYRYVELDGKIEDVYMFWFYNQIGFVMVYMYNYKLGNKYCFFVFGCDYMFCELDQKQCKDLDIQYYGCCWYVYECIKCGFIELQDLSD